MVKQPLLTIEPTGNISLLLGNIEYQEYSYKQSRPSGSDMRHGKLLKRFIEKIKEFIKKLDR